MTRTVIVGVEHLVRTHLPGTLLPVETSVTVGHYNQLLVSGKYNTIVHVVDMF